MKTIKLEITIKVKDPNQWEINDTRNLKTYIDGKLWIGDTVTIIEIN